MLKIPFAILIVSAYASGATLPDIPPVTSEKDIIEELVPQTETPVISESQNLINSNDINEVPVENESKVCSSETCARESALMRSYIDYSVDPCNNFYQFACGRFIRETNLPEDKPIQMSFVQVQDNVERQLQTVLSEESEPNESKPFRLAKDFYKLCLDEATLNAKGIEPMIEILEQYGGWPVVKGSDWNADNSWDWMEANKQLSNDGLPDGLILTLNIATDSKNSSKRILTVDQPTFGLSGRFLLVGLEHPNVKAYLDYMVDVAVIFGANQTHAEIELRDSLEFERKLAKISATQEQRRNVTALYNPFTIQQLQTTYPYINWLEFINWNLRNQTVIDENEIVIVYDTNYLSQLNEILQSTSNRTIANYFAWRSILLGAKFLNSDFHERHQAYLATTTGMLKSDPRHAECVKQTMAYLSISVGAAYVQKYFNEESKKAASNLVDRIHEEFVKTLKNVPWMDDETKAAAIDKVGTVDYHIGYPNELADNNKLEEHYSGLELDPNSYLQSLLRIRNFEINNFISKLRQPVNKTDWESHSMPAIVNAFYSSLENSIQLPAAVLQDRFFSAERPSYMNFGYIGWFIGHELTHGFDDEGRSYDKNGNLVDWWRADTAAKFASRAQCIIDQYSNYTKSGTNLRVNGVNTQGENIADNGAVKLAYAAYQTFVEQNGPEPILPELNYTPNQLFWLSSAQLWCAVTRPEFDTMQYTTDVHAPNEYRIIGTLSNVDSFSHDFNCPSGSNMNPINKCVVW